MADNFDNFIRRINIRATNVPREVNRVVRLAALAINQTVVMATPVDTGRARSNWLVSLGRPREDVIEPYSPLRQGQDAGKLGEGANARGALAQGQEQIAARVPEQVIFISNNVGYIGALNRGTSVQAPAMFVEAAIDAAVAVVAGAKIDTGQE